MAGMPQPAANPLLSRIRYGTDYKTTWLRVFTYGGTRSGKTRQATLFPRPFLISPPNENGVQTIAGEEIPYFIPGEHDVLSTQKDMEGLMQLLHTDMTKLNVAKDGGAAFREKWGETFVWDSVTHYTDAIINALNVKRGKDGRPELDPETGALRYDTPDKQTWGALRSHLTNVRDILFRLPCHVVITSLDATTTDDRGNVTWRGPRIQGAGGELIPSSCELVGLCDSVGADNFVIYFQKYGQAEAGTRLRGMRPQMMRVGLSGNTLYDQLVPYIGAT